MWIVLLALRRPLTFVVLSLLLLLLTPYILFRTPTDIFPAINIPVVSVVWSYTGLNAKEMEQRIIFGHERALTTTVNNIEHIESTSYDGIGVVKIFFQPGTSPDAGVAQVTAISQTVLRQMPPGTTPPLVIQYNASTVPILQYGISSPSLNEQQVGDISLNQIRVGLISVPGAGIPYPYGGKSRLISVDLNMKSLEEKNLSPIDVVTAMSNQNLIYPSGTAKIGGTEYPIDVNTSPLAIDALNELPIKTVEGSVIRIRDVAQVRDGYDPQRNIVRQDGLRSTLISVLKNGSASTLAVASGVKDAMKKTIGTLTASDVKVTEFVDQSIFVRGAVLGVVKEGVIAAALTAVMILLFLGSWRSTIIIAISIPLAVLASLAVLSALGQTINLMTLGGLALAVGILVDDATVTIENIERHLQAGEKLEDGIIKGAAEIALPAMVSTLCICIVFVPMFFLGGVAGYLFAPLAMAVVFAVLASYVLSRTLVPTLVMWFERSNPHWKHHDENEPKKKPPFWMRPFMAIQRGFERGYNGLLNYYKDLLAVLLKHRVIFALVFLAFCIGSLGLVPFLGRDFFPTVDSGAMRLHVRAPTGMRIEETAALVDRIEQSIRKQIPAEELKGVLDNIGLPNSGINLSYSDSGITGVADADIMIALQEEHHPTAEYVRKLRLSLNQEFPGAVFYFLPSDIVTQTINFGLPAPFDIQLVGRDVEGNQKVAAALAEKIRHIPGAVDVRIQQPGNLQRLGFEVDRTKASQLGLAERDVASSILLGLSGSSVVSPSYWLDRRVGVQYVVNIRVPEYRMDSLWDLKSMPVSVGLPGTDSGQLLTNLSTVNRTASSPIYSHYDVQPVVDIFGGISGRDLAGVLSDITPLLKDGSEFSKMLPKGSHMVLRGQAQTMRASFIGLGVGLIAAVLLIYLLLVINFQSWLDPFIILTALFGALAGVAWGLHLTNTTLSVPAMMGAIMCLGVATANSVLVVTFARQNLNDGHDPIRAAWEAGHGRLRPVIMTATAMIIGMVPMSLGLGDGGEQNAPLGRAVIGGLLMATIATLFFVPSVFAIMHRKGKKELPPEIHDPTKEDDHGHDGAPAHA